MNEMEIRKLKSEKVRKLEKPKCWTYLDKLVSTPLGKGKCDVCWDTQWRRVCVLLGDECDECETHRMHVAAHYKNIRRLATH